MSFDTSQQQFWNSVQKRRTPMHPAIKATVMNRLEQVKTALPNLSEARVLEIGAGNGNFSYYLEPMCRQFQAVDFSHTMLGWNPCRSKVVANAYALPFQDNEFDVVFETYMLHHLEHIDAALEEMKRVTKHYIVLFEPNALNPCVAFNSLLKKSERNGIKFTKNFLAEKVRAHGFVVVHSLITGVIPPNMIPTPFVRFLKPIDRFAFPVGTIQMMVSRKEETL